MEFNGTAFVTGAGSCHLHVIQWMATDWVLMLKGSGIGQALALLYAQRGCQNIAVADIRMDAINRTTELIHKAAPHVKVFEVVVDVADEQSIQEAVSSTVERFGGIQYGKQ